MRTICLPWRSAGEAMSLRNTSFILLLCTAIAAAGGCSRGEPRETPIEAKGAVIFAKWRQKVAHAFSPDEWREFDAALNEIRLGLMITEEATGSAAIQQALLQRVDGRTFEEALALGYSSQLLRLDLARREARDLLEGNALLAVRPGDHASARHLEELTRRQQARLQTLEGEIEAVQKKRAALRGPSSGPEDNLVNAPRESAPTPLSRDEVWTQFTHLVQQQRAAAMFRFGAWPARVDESGAGLTGGPRDEFAARRSAAADAGRVVIAVYVKNRWWIYEGALEPPVFSAAVTARLSDADRAAMRTTWSHLQAEVWARREAFNAGIGSASERRETPWRGSAPPPLFPAPQP